MSATPTLVSGDEGNVFGSRRHAEYLVAVDLALHLGQVSEGAGDSRREVRDVTHLHQKLLDTRKAQHNGNVAGQGRAVKKEQTQAASEQKMETKQ